MHKCMGSRTTKMLILILSYFLKLRMIVISEDTIFFASSGLSLHL